MKTLALFQSRFWRLLFVCLATLFAALAAVVVEAAEPGDSSLGPSREFWVWDLRVMPPGFRKARASPRAIGLHSLVYVEEALWEKGNVSAGYVQRLHWQLETAAPAGAFRSELGIVPLEEKVFGPLPKKFDTDHRLIVLFADLGQYKDHQFDGFFNAFDQLPEAEAWARHQQHSNEANLIYLNGFRGTEAYTTGVIAHELQHLLASGSAAEEPQENWLSESLAEGAMLLAGFYGDQGHVSRFAGKTGQQPLVSSGYVSYGPQLLFSSFLMDAFPGSPESPLAWLTRSRLRGRAAVETLFRERAELPLSFDAIFSNFVSYVFSSSQNSSPLPQAWRHSPAIVVPEIPAHHRFPETGGELLGKLAPYSFLAIDLAKEISPGTLIQLQREGSLRAPEAPKTCENDATLLWKPVHARRIAIYSVGCDPGEKASQVAFRLRILEQPSLLPLSPIRLLP